MRRWLLARQAFATLRSYVVSSPRIIPNNPNTLLHPPSPLFPHSRFFSQITDLPLASVIDDVTTADVEELEKVESLLQSNDADLESSLDSIGFTLDQDFVIKLLQTSNVSGYNLIRFIKWALDKNESFDVTVPVVESLVSNVCSGGGVLREKLIYSLWDFVKDIAGDGVRALNTDILNEVIVSFSKLGKGRTAHEVFDKFELFQCVPNADSYYFTIEALCRRKDFDQAWSLCQKMIDAEIIPDDEKVGKIISWFSKGGRVKQAHLVYLAAKEKGKQVPMSSVSFLIAKLCQQSKTVRLNGKPVARKLKPVGESFEENENVRLALEILNGIPGDEKKHSMKSFSAVIQALCRIKDVDTAKELILKMTVDGPPPGNGVFNFVITEYAKAGKMVQAIEMLRLLESRGLKPDLYTYAVLMSGYSNGGELDEAKKILEEAKKKHVKLTPVMYHTIIRGYCKLEQFDEALKLLTEMKDFGVRPTADEYEKLIQSLCLKALDWETAEKLQEEMKENGLHLKGISRALIRAVKEMEKEVADDGNISSAA
ncbi:PREDICTED: pentatricopeptide repeat-containing protein At3g02650, mitochondrial isoform X2 [Lupinus angustifolius]|uniref:pentatricopeptide repeat-containing protein At3g02650, mitochondrial isoform X2 n=1 Tax=Lupinus angustifolius TaxID=3871 RepID=UPI00092F2580|nr:PREDICTED: pentatricopeptide repeat-containing protein At3g02650, mitochondrial isoform X2 [Lupinus angustifolius]